MMNDNDRKKTKLGGIKVEEVKYNIVSGNFVYNNRNR